MVGMADGYLTVNNLVSHKMSDLKSHIIHGEASQYGVKFACNVISFYQTLSIYNLSYSNNRPAYRGLNTNPTCQKTH